jgi:predicted nucleic acid-binding protein
VIARRRLTHVVIDTDVASFLLDPRPSAPAEAARRIVAGRAKVVSFVTVAELRFGALRAGWGELRVRALHRSLADLDVIQSDEVLIARYAMLRAELHRAGHGLGQKVHEADRWIAATAVALGLELATGDRVFENVAGLDVVRLER